MTEIDNTFKIVDGVGLIGGRPVEHGEVFSEDYSLGLGMGISHRRQILCSFANGWKLSVIFGTHTYSSNRDWSTPEERPALTAEIAVIHPTAGLTELFGFDWSDTVKGYLTTDEVWDYYKMVEDLPLIEDEEM